MNISQKNIFLACSLSSGLEFYDFAIYINFYAILSQLFFPKAHHYQAVLEIFSIFAAGYLARPLGGLIFSHLGDTRGRKSTLLKTILGITLPTFLISSLPVHTQFHTIALTLLLLLRIIQGICLGGEVPGALTYIAEVYPHKQLAFYFSMIFVIMNLGNFMAIGLSYLLKNNLSPQALLQWGWRVPFFLGGIMGIIIYYFRYKIQESSLFEEIIYDQKTLKLPIVDIFSRKFLLLIQGIALTASGATVVVLLHIYMPAYLKLNFSYSDATISSIYIINTVILCIAVLIWARLADKFGHRRILFIAYIALLLLAYPCYKLLGININATRFSTMILMLLSAAVISSYTATLIPLFDTPSRYTGIAMSFNIGFALFGGTAPFIATALIHLTHNPLSPVFYLLLVIFLGLLATLSLKSSCRQAS